jgi:hypothetical protein
MYDRRALMATNCVYICASSRKRKYIMYIHQHLQYVVVCTNVYSIYVLA